MFNKDQPTTVCSSNSWRTWDKLGLKCNSVWASLNVGWNCYKNFYRSVQEIAYSWSEGPCAVARDIHTEQIGTWSVMRQFYPEIVRWSWLTVIVSTACVCTLHIPDKILHTHNPIHVYVPSLAQLSIAYSTEKRERACYLCSHEWCQDRKDGSKGLIVRGCTGPRTAKRAKVPGNLTHVSS